jgi:TetR/AcrR family transcriptional regulator, mexJK operon transcriptional repressor
LSVTEQTLESVMEVINGIADRELYAPGDITERLTAFIRATAHVTTRLPERAALLRVILTEAPRFPALLDQWQGRRALTPLLERALAELGPGSSLDIADPREAAGHLAALTFGQINNRTLFGLLQLTDDELDAIVVGGVGVFVRAYRRAD